MSDRICVPYGMTKLQIRYVIAEAYKNGMGDLIRKPTHCQRAECCVCKNIRQVKCDVDGGVTMICDTQGEGENE